MTFQNSQRIQPFSALLFCALCFALFFALPAHAQVIEIQPDGSLLRYDGPVVASSNGIHPLIKNLSGVQPKTPQPALTETIRKASATHALSPELVEAVAWQESRLQQNVVSPKGARGVMQLMPETARGLGVNPADVQQNVHGGTLYLAQMMKRFDGDVMKALAAYNAGPEAVTRYGGVPPYRETRNYVNAILDRLSLGR